MGGGEVVLPKRLMIEKKEITKEYKEVEVSQDQSNKKFIMTFTNKKTMDTISVECADRYPFSKPIISINDVNIEYDDWPPAQRITKFLEKYLPGKTEKEKLLLRRIKYEEKQITAMNSYSHPNISESYVFPNNFSMRFTKTSTADNIIVKFSDEYPDIKPTIIINGVDIGIDDWSSTRTIVEYLAQYDADKAKKKILILCHTDKVTGSFESYNLNGHWMGNPYNTELEKDSIFKKLFSNFNLTGEAVFQTVDIQNVNTCTYPMTDAFSMKFIEKHINQYDLIMVPDCAGIWSDDQESDVKSDVLILKCILLTNMLKHNGIIMFSKFLSDPPYFFEKFNQMFKKNNFTVKEGDKPFRWVIAQKKGVIDALFYKVMMDKLEKSEKTEKLENKFEIDN